MRNLRKSITFESGVLESQESSTVPVGFCTECVNWVPEPTGGLRPRARWEAGSTAGALPATRRNVGIGMFSRFTDPQIVQQTPVVAMTGNGSPVFSWPAPTSTGNTLLALVSYTSSIGVSTTFTATGWTARQPISGSAQQQVGLYELVTTQSYSGDVTPFTVSGASGSWIIWILEVAGLSGFDVIATASGSGTSISPTSATTTQASAFVIALDTARGSGSTALTLSTATSGWSEGGERGASVANYHDAAWYYGVRRAVGAQSLTITSTLTATHVGLIAAYKGWNTVASPEDLGNSMLAANDDGTNIDIWSIAREDVDTGTWTSVDANVAANTSAPVAFTLGLNRTWYSGSGFTGIRAYNGTAPTTVTGSPANVRALAVHKQRLWAAAGTRLSYSQVGDGFTWTGRGSSYIDIGTEDGEPIEDITPFADGLVIGKRTSAWFLSGDTPSSFVVTRLNAGGAAPGRSVLSTPYGCVMAGREQVWLFDGASVQPIGRAVEDSYGVADGDFVSCSYIDGSIYIADGGGEQVFVFALDAGNWRFEKVGTNSAEAVSVLYNYADVQYYGPVAGTIGSLLNFRTFPGPERGKDFGTMPMVFSAATGDLWFGGAENPITPRHIWMQVRQREDGIDEELGVTLTYDDGGIDILEPVASGTEGVRRDRIDTGARRGVGSVKISLSQTLAGTEETTFDIEAMRFDYDQSEPAGNTWR